MTHNLPAILLTLSIIAGQLIKIPFGRYGGITLLDIIIIILTLIGLFRTKLSLGSAPNFVKTAVIFIFIASISLFFTPLTLTSQEYLTSLSYTVRFTFYILFGFLVYSNVFPKLKEQILKILLRSGVTLAILGLLQFVFLPNLEFLAKYLWDPHYFRTVSTFLDPNFAGAYFTLTLLLLTSYLGGRSIMTPRVYYLLFTIVYLALLTTFSRSTYLAFLAGFLVISFFNKSFRMAVLTFVLFAGLILGFTVYQHSVAQPRNIDRTQSAQYRLNTWQQGWQITQKYPILGVGFNAYRFALRQNHLADEKFISSRGASYNDSSLLHVASTTGIIGLVSYLFFLFSYAWTGRHNLILLSGLVGLIAQSFFANTLFYPFLLLWVILIAVFKQTKKGNFLFPKV